ncbi:hypothetical protein KBD61_00035 [Patescibacteria group bacterium]|nr:hypothetical protein [Patescibacteria group bacterium]MBP9709398.1 hypothetical protein [Patescibacteria group bacterium]
MQHETLLNTFELADLGAAAAIASIGFKLLGLEPTDGRRVVFVFQNEPGIGEAIERFWSGQLTVDALAYFGAVKLLKSRLHAIAR